MAFNWRDGMSLPGPTPPSGGQYFTNPTTGTTTFVAAGAPPPPGMVPNSTLPNGVPSAAGPAPGSAPAAAAAPAPSADNQELTDLQAQVAALQAQIANQQSQQAAQAQQDQLNAVQALQTAMPWLQQMGLTDQIKQWVVEGYTDPNALVALVRQTSQWQQMFPGIRRDDGTLRSDEATYLNNNDQFRQSLRNAGIDTSVYNTPQSLAAFHVQGITPEELTSRLTTYTQLERSSDDVKAAFYVYGGLNVSTDDLYRATIDPAYAGQLQTAYTQALATAPPDYATFLNRSTEFALNSVAAKVAAVTGNASQITAQQLQMMDPTDARALMDQLYHGGNPQGGQYLSVDELQNAFQNAMVGGALSSSGLSMPNASDVQKWRQAGVDQAAAYKTGADVFAHQNLYSGALARSGRGSGFSQNQLENAEFGTDAQQALLLSQANQSEQALGQQGGGVGIKASNVPGLLQQTGYLGRY